MSESPAASVRATPGGDTTDSSLDRSWHAQSAEAVLDALGVAVEGLSTAEVEERRAQFGPNTLRQEAPDPLWWRVLRHFHDVLIYVLLGAAAVTALLGEWIDTGVIVGVVLVNALIGFVQEGKAEQALASIRGMLSLKARVRRDGARREVPAESLVPGDIVFVASGDRVPADLRLFSTTNLQVEEAALTGESVPVTKHTAPVDEAAGIGDRTCMAYSGTTVTRGQGRGVVVATGGDTEIGRIGKMLSEVESLTTPLLRKINAFGGRLSIAILGICAATFGYGYAFQPLYGVEDLFLVVVGLAVAAIPEGLPAIMTITLALGVQRMAQQNAIIRQLPAVETLGSVTVICSDKTGTLTRNEMSVRRVLCAGRSYTVTGSGYAPEGTFRLDGDEVAVEDHSPLWACARAGLLASDASVRHEDGTWRLDGDPTEGGVVAMASKAGLHRDAVEAEAPRLDLIPFESEHRYMATLHRTSDGDRSIFLKGAPERILPLCDRERTEGGTASLDPAPWETKMTQMAEEGHRLLAVAARSHDADALGPDDVEGGGFVLLGVLGLLDPPRNEVVSAVEACHRAGIQVKMITGDHAVTARSIGAMLGIGNGEDAVTGAQLEEVTDEGLVSVARAHDLFARTSPEHKLRLVQALQADGQIVAMTGDGVNDAPALKRADVGVAMGVKGAEVSKDAADMVLADDNFATIKEAVEEGRTVYDNLTKAILFILPTNGAEALMMIATVLFAFAHLPITPVQILWVNMVTAVTLALALAFEPSEPGIMTRPPRAPDAPILSGALLWRIGFVSVLIATAALQLFQWQLDGGRPTVVAQTIAVNTLVAGQVFYLFNSRYLRRSSLSLRRLFQNTYALLAGGILLVLQLGFTYLPFMQTLFGTAAITAADWGVLSLVGIGVFLVVEAEKALLRWWRSPRTSPM
ncbi:MAG: cation-transporting P-type ATPase [Salinibacter sp.]